MKLKKILIILTIVLLFSMFFIMPVLAGSISGQVEQFGGQIGASKQSLPNLAALIINSILSVLGLLFFVLILYGGYLYMTSQGEQDKVKKAKQTLTTAIIGLLIILTAYAISAFVINIVLVGSGTSY